MHGTFLKRSVFAAGSFAAAGLVTSAALGQGLSTYYELEEGELQEVWYEPEDWRTTEWYEDEEGEIEEWLHSDYDYGYVEDEAAFRRFDYDGYHDGYYDGYHMLESAFKDQSDDPDKHGDEQFSGRRSDNYRNAYVDGYQDGSYDQQREYPADPYYYVYVVDLSAPGKASNALREADNSRTRGDRCTQFTRRGTDAYKTDRASHRDRVRGTVVDITPVEMEGEHDLMRLSFHGGRNVVADFGPHLTHAAFPVAEGDRVTIVGREKMHDDQEVLVANRLIVNDEKYTLRGVADQAPGTSSPQDRERRPAQTRADNDVTLRGQLAELREVEEDDIEDADDMEGSITPDRTFARLRLQDGQTATLAFGDDVEIDDLAVSTGDQLTIRGKEVVMHGQTVVEVQSILVNGRPIDITND